MAARVALITGASRGIGRGCALALAEAGADVAVNYRSHPDEAAEVVRAAEALGRRAIAIQADIADRAGVAAMVAATQDRLGRLDVLVANAYRPVRGPFLEVTPDDLERATATNLVGTFHCCQLAARAMVEQGEGGAIVIIGSVHGERAFPGASVYNMAKFGLQGLAATMAAELAAHRVRVNVVNPGWIDTPGERAKFGDVASQGARRVPWGRIGEPADIGRAVAFLCSPAADFITGSALRVDGGHVAAMRLS